MGGELRGFDITDETKRKVKDVIRNYYTYKEKSNEKIEEDEYYTVLSPSYDRIMTSPTNNITDTTKMGAIRISDKKMEIDTATAIVNAIEKGIERAANTSARLDLSEGLRQDLFDNMVDKRPREFFARQPRTFTKYRRRAYYFIAEELGLIDRR